MEVAGNARVAKHQQGVVGEYKMTIEQITDANYLDFKNHSRAALIVGTSWCKHCEQYTSIINTSSKQMPYIRFGKTIIDKDRSSQLKREYPDMNSWTFPTTLLFKEKREVSRIKGMSLYPAVISKIKKDLILESKVFVPGENGKYIPAIIKHINDNGIYRLQLIEDSLRGRKESIIELEKEEFLWGLEDRV